MLVLQVQEFNKNSYTFESKGQKLILFRSMRYSSEVFVYVRSNILYLVVIKEDHLNKGNNKITELRTILQRESPNS